MRADLVLRTLFLPAVWARSATNVATASALARNQRGGLTCRPPTTRQAYGEYRRHGTQWHGKVRRDSPAFGPSAMLVFRRKSRH